MNHPPLARWAVPVLCAAALSACVAYPYPGPYGAPIPVAGPSTFDRSWDAALGAAADAGVQVTSADRGSGRIAGSRGGEAVTINVQTRADGSVQVAFNASPGMSDNLSAAYNRRMGR